MVGRTSLVRAAKAVQHHALPRTRSFTSSRSFERLQTELTAPNGVKWEQPLGLFIGNEFIPSADGSTMPTVNPYTETNICSVFVAGPSDVDKAVRAARGALQHPSWRHLSGTQRSHLLHRLADLVERESATLSALETLDNGKPLSASRGWDVPQFSEVLRYYAGYADKNPGAAIDVGPGKLAYTIKAPVGVCAAILPWNYPLAMAAWKLGPALACGNAVVVKPSEVTPLSMLYVAGLAREAGFPAGVINVVNGSGRVGGELTRHVGVDKVAFTGSTAVGKEVMRAAAGTMKGVTLETGGKSPLIVFGDADVGQAVRWAHEGGMGNMGQMCTATSRVLVQREVLGDVVRGLEDVAGRAVLGDPFDEGTTQGPLVSRAQAERVLGYYAAGTGNESGSGSGSGRVMYPRGKEVPSRGFFVPPAIFAGVDIASAVWREEIFGPCVALAGFEGEEEAVEMANDSRYGLAGAVFTRDLARAHRVARELEAGMVWVNSSNDSDVRVPFGGVKESGLGRELGEEGLRGYYTVKAVHVNLTEE